MFCAKVFCTGYESQRYYGQDLYFLLEKKKKSKQQKSYKNQRHNILLLEIVGEDVHTHINNKHNKLHNNKETRFSEKRKLYFQLKKLYIIVHSTEFVWAVAHNSQ